MATNPIITHTLSLSDLGHSWSFLFFKKLSNNGRIETAFDYRLAIGRKNISGTFNQSKGEGP
jgi:hypothetical protein